MAKLRSSLQNRITTLIILSSVLFISTFTFIQINNQTASINRYNTYQINLSSTIVKNNLENALRAAPGEEAHQYLQTILRELKDNKVISETFVFNGDGKIVASTNDQDIGENVSYKDLNRMDQLNTLPANKWYLADVENQQHKVEMFLPLKPPEGGPAAYFTKILFPIANIQEALAEVYRPVILSIIIIIIANLLLGYVLSRMVIGPIKTLNKVTKIIAEGDLSIRTNIKTDDELEELGSTFNYMTEQLIKMKERAENANPLTKLPGNIVIREETEKRIKNNLKFTVIYSDLDNFKAFNDKYGIAKGDEVIKLTADILRNAVKMKGSADDFVGHEGGDDFIVLSTPEKSQEVADYIIQEFDKSVRAVYSEEDRAQGYIIAHARDGSIKQFPIMTISMVGVSNQNKIIGSYAQVTNLAAEMKKKAKSINASVFLIDSRKD